MTTLLKHRLRAARPVDASPGDGTGLMLLVLFALVFVPVLAVHAAFLIAPPAAVEDAQPLRRLHP